MNPLPSDDDDFDIIDGKKVLKDGRRLRVPLHMMDGVQRDVRSHFGPVRAADGTQDGLHRPGYRVTDFRDATAYRDYDQELTNAWRNPPRMHFAGEGDVCTVKGEEYPEAFGSPGHLRRIKGQLVCVPDDNNKTDHAISDERQRAYADYDRQLADAWRGTS